MATMKQTAAALGVSERTIRDWIKKGCPASRKRKKKGQGGRPPYQFNVAKVKKWIGERGITPRYLDAAKKPKGKKKAAKKTDGQVDQVGQAKPDTNKAPPDKNLSRAGLIGALARLRTMERISYADYVTAVKEKQSVASVRAKEKLYIDAHDALRRTEKELPKILEHRGEAIPLETVLEEQSKIDLAIKTELLSLPRKLAPELSRANDPAEVEEILTRSIDECCRHIASGEALPK